MKRIFCILPLLQIQASFFYLCCVVLFISNFAVAQTQRGQPNSVSIAEEMRLFIAKSDATDSIEVLIQDTFFKKKDPILALAYCKTYLERGREENNPSIQLFANFQIAHISYLQPDYDEALKRSYIAARIAEREKDTMYAISSNALLGSTWYVKGMYEEALKPYLIAKELSADIESDSHQISCLTNIANVRAKLHRYNNALENFNSILAILDKKEQPLSDEDTQILLSSLLGKVLCLTELKRFDEAQATYAKGFAIAEAINDEIFKSRFNVNLGKVYYEKGEYAISLGFLQAGKKVMKEAGLKNNLYITDFYIAQNLTKQGKNEEAIALLDAIFKRAGEDSYTDRIEEMYALAIKISQIQDDKDKELFYQREIASIIKVKNEQKSAAKDLLHEDDMNEFKLENKKLANENTQTLVDKKVTMIVSIALVALLLITFLAYYRKAKLKEQKFLAIIDNISKKAAQPKPEKTVQNPAIKDEKAQAILAALTTLEDTHFYLSEEATLHSTAKLLNTNTTYLSKALNAVKKQTFSQYLNKLRIDYVLVKLKEDAVFRSYTIHAISKEIGYKSATTFIKEFKNKTGLNPSYYIRKIES
ncbi:MAG: helix-turn-helix domain-containing protein [Bacteroidota bacterium]